MSASQKTGRRREGVAAVSTAVGTAAAAVVAAVVVAIEATAMIRTLTVLPFAIAVQVR